jgi:hypothetical protein
MTLDVFLLILRLLGIVLLYLFLMQVIISITRDLRKTAAANEDVQSKLPPVVGRLVVVDSGPSKIAPGTTFNLNPQTTIGRGPTNTIQISESFVSAEHARMWLRNGVWYVQDASSNKSTFLNGESTQTPLTARVGDIIQVGFIRFKLAQ